MTHTYDSLDNLFGLPSFARLSWQTAADVIEKNCLKITWEDKEEEEEEENQKKLKKTGSKRAIDETDSIESEPEVKLEVPDTVTSGLKSRKSAFFRENNLQRVDLEAFSVLF